MDLSSLNELDFNESGEWPIPIKVVAVLVLCILVWAASYWFVLKDVQKSLTELEQKETELKKTFEPKQAKAGNLGAYEKQAEEIKVSFSSMLQQLPQKNEMNVNGLLDDISRIGLASGVVLERLKLESTRTVDIYTELPFDMVIIGSYHQLGKFISGIAKLPRIVTLHDFSMRSLASEDDKGKMTMDIVAKTYYQVFDVFDESN